MKKQEKNKREILNKRKNIIISSNTKGITLIALVLTIIILMILAGISINLVLGDNGIITKAKVAKAEMEQAKQNEEIGLNETAKYIEEMGASGSTTNPPTEIKEITEVKGGDYFEKTTTIKDNNENLIKVPEGFKIADDSGTNVTEGIVIEDNDIIDGIGNNKGNQYVWVPVGTGIKKSDGTTVDITLGRYIFADGTNDKDSSGNVLTKGTPILKQSAENYADETEINVKEIRPTTSDDYVYKELTMSRIGVVDTSNRLNDTNTTALNLKGFIDSVKANGGYYIARYEASYGTDGKANSKISNSYSYTKGVVPTAEGTLWNNITQINAATASRSLYTKATTDLVNSYAWDTAIVYIQNFSGDTDYSYQEGTGINSSLRNTGTNGDEVCKINDMASNACEWTTEYNTETNSSTTCPCTHRGGLYTNKLNYTSTRYNGANTTKIYEIETFRPILYI